MTEPAAGPPTLPAEMELVRRDPWLAPHAEALRARHAGYLGALQRLAPTGGVLGAASRAHRRLGLLRGHRHGHPGTWYREWAPAAHALFLIGDFNGWSRAAHPLARAPGGTWELFLPDGPSGPALPHASRYKVHVVSADGALDRIPALATRVVQDPETHDFAAQVWSPPRRYRFRHRPPPPPRSLRIYEAHVGMAQETPGIGSFTDFAEGVLPRIAALGYNAVQLMAIAEHPYYGSFGYHVSSFYAPSSRFGSPEDLRRLVDTAHGLGLRVLMDLVHSHAVKNVLEGLNRFDGTDHQYFHAGPRGEHPTWDSRLFNYAHPEVESFLLSNVRYWLEEFRFDGFRFDGVTSMLYLDHGLGHGFRSYDDYFGENVDEEALLYLRLANEVVRAVRPDAVTIAEDVSGMPGMARPGSEGGLGFDFRLAMGVPDYWIRQVRERRDEEWRPAEIFATLLNRRRDEPHVGYAESHDQALVGDKTLAFRLMDAAMYGHMRRGDEHPAIERGLALLKLIRLLTFSLAGEAYLNFMGNEFGHPEWVDFPREGNGYSYHYARRQWSLVDNPALRYRGLAEFDQALQHLDEEHGLLASPQIELLAHHDEAQWLVYRRGPLVFAANLSPTLSHADFAIPVPEPRAYRVVLNTEEPRFEGPGRSESGTLLPLLAGEGAGVSQVRIYLPTRSGQVLAPAS